MNSRQWNLTKRIAVAALLIACAAAVSRAGRKSPTWTSADKAAENDPAFTVQGEYVGTFDGDEDKPVGVQVIALGGKHLQAVIYPGGLPGAGWDGKNRSLADGTVTGENAATFAPPEGKKKYLGKGESFSATKKYPPTGHAPWELKIAGETMTGKSGSGKTLEAKHTVRKSPTLGAAPPDGAIMLFSGSKEDMENFKGGRFDDQTKLLNTDGRDIRTSKSFDDYTMHVEFMLPYRPHARGQGRGNSGVYQVDTYEVQVLDSFGLEGRNNECGGIYKTAAPKVNMCLPPLQWQTYDVEFTNAELGEDGKVATPAKMTVRHNGVVIHEDQKLPKGTGGGRKQGGKPGPIKLQGHGNPLQYRNIWIVPK